MAKYTSLDIKRLAKAIRRARDKKRPFNMMTGAGCSFSAGIPLAGMLIKEILKQYGDDCRNELEEKDLKNYGKCMNCLGLNDQRDILQPYLDKAQVNWANIAIASMMHGGYVDRVLTFNFDSVLTQACGLLGMYPATYDFAAAASNVTDYLTAPAIIHLHGQGYSLRMLSSEDETTSHAQKLRPLMQQCFQKAPFLVIGYSGQSDAMFPIIEEEYTGAERLYWADIQATPNETIVNLLEKRKKIVKYLGEADADQFLIKLAHELNCWPPKLFTDHRAHLLNELKTVKEFPVGDDTGHDLLAHLREKLCLPLRRTYKSEKDFFYLQ